MEKDVFKESEPADFLIINDRRGINATFIDVFMLYGTAEGAIVDDDKNVAELLYVQVDEEFRRQGIAEKLVKEFALEAIKRGAKAIECAFINEAAVNLFLKAFGQKNIEFSYCDSDGLKETIPFDKAYEAVEEYRIKTENLSIDEADKIQGISGRVDLTKIRISS